MEMKDKIEEIKTSLKKISRNHKFKVANKEREKRVDSQAAIMKCRGQLEASLKDFSRNIRSQADFLSSGKHSETEVAMREQLLWDSALCYMLVRDAISAIQTVSSNETIMYSYKLLDTAVSLMNGKNKKIPSYNAISSKRSDRYDMIKSDAFMKSKVQVLESIFEDLKKSGDIEACLAAAENKDSAVHKDIGKVDKTSPEYLKSLANSKSVVTDSNSIDIDDIDTML